MRRRTAGIALAVLAPVALACSRPVPYRHLPSALPAVAGKDAPGLPPLPEASPRNASYSIDARLDPDKHTIAGSLLLEWRNTSGRALDSFPFHLYWNAFRNNRSTFFLESGGHGVVTQFGCLASSESPGQPENVTTTGTSIRCARHTVLRNTSSYWRARSACGCSGLP